MLEEATGLPEEFVLEIDLENMQLVDEAHSNPLEVWPVLWCSFPPPSMQDA